VKFTPLVDVRLLIKIVKYLLTFFSKILFMVTSTTIPSLIILFFLILFIKISKPLCFIKYFYLKVEVIQLDINLCIF